MTLRMVLLHLLMLVSTSALAQIEEPLRNPQGLETPEEQIVYKVDSARVVLIDEELIKRDFPELKDYTTEQLKQWLLESAGYISRGQVEGKYAKDVNGKVNKGLRRYALRPVGYGRALVYKVVGMLKKSGLIDVKGAGAKSPKQQSHGNGLLSTAEAIREMLFTQLVSTVLADAVKRAEVDPEIHELLRKTGIDPAVGMKIVGVYGVIDWGFDMLNADGSSEPAGAVLRQAHQRPKFWQSFFLDRMKGLALEKLLRHYGITSTGAYRLDPKVQVDWINLQATRDGKAIYDVGAFMAAEDHYTRPLTHFDDSANILSKPGDPDWVQPNPEIAVDYNLWGVSRTGKLDVTYDNPTIYSRETIIAARKKFAEGKEAEGMAYLKAHLDNFVTKYRVALETKTAQHVTQRRAEIARAAAATTVDAAAACSSAAAAVHL